jgi:hypothetical protein
MPTREEIEMHYANNPESVEAIPVGVKADFKRPNLSPEV